MRSWPVAGSVVLVWAMIAPCLGGPTHIVVNIGDYPSAQKASDDEANIGWNDGRDADDIICTESFAAVELQKFLRLMTGDTGRFDIVDDDKVPNDGALIILGNPKSNKLLTGGLMKLDVKDADFEACGKEGYLIRTGALNTGRQLMVIGGATRIGTLYGVYGFLDRLGVRWFAPGQTGQVVPTRNLDELPQMTVTDKPQFFTRGFHAWEYRGDADFFDWMVRNHMNYWCVEEKNRAGLKKRGIQMNCGNHVLIPRFLGPTDKYPYNHSKFEGDDKDNLPPDPYAVSPDFKGDVNNDGKLTYFEAHPEWYGLKGGKRSNHIEGDSGDNFCTANKDAVDEFMKNLVQDLISGVWKDADSLNFWTLDGGRWCECEPCKALGIPTDRNLALVYRCRQEMKKAMAEGRLKRDIMIYFLAYYDVLTPPTKPLPQDFDYDHCIATYFPIARCYVHTLNDPNCTEYNTRYEKNLYGWALDPNRYYKGQIFIGEYYNVSGYRCLPVMYWRTMTTDMPYYYKISARHMHYMHCTTKNWGTKALTNYQFARMMWNPQLDAKALLDDYLGKRYGAVAPQMRQLYERLDTALGNVTELKYGLSGRLNANAKELFPRKHMKKEKAHFENNNGPSLTEMVTAIGECQELLKKAQASCSDKAIRARLAEDAGPLAYGTNTIRFYVVLSQITQDLQAGKKTDALKLLPEMKRLAKALEDDTTSTQWSSSHASSPDALEASYVKGAYKRLLNELEPPPPAKVHDLAPGKPLTLWGSDFQGGGRTKFNKGFGLKVGGAGRKIDCPKGNYIYANPTPGFCYVTVAFRLPKVPPNGVTLKLWAMSAPVEGQADTAIKIRLNDTQVFAGPSECPEGKLTERSFTIRAEALKEGANTLRIDSLESSGGVGSRPWFGIDKAELQAR